MKQKDGLGGGGGGGGEQAQGTEVAMRNWQRILLSFCIWGKSETERRQKKKEWRESKSREQEWRSVIEVERKEKECKGNANRSTEQDGKRIERKGEGEQDWNSYC